MVGSIVACLDLGFFTFCTIDPHKVKLTAGVLEWVEYHLLAGVQHMYLYNHKSVDNASVELHPYVTAGIVDLHQWDLPGHPQVLSVSPSSSSPPLSICPTHVPNAS